MAQMKRRVEVEGVEEARFAPTLVSQMADAKAARLLISDELPESERPREGDRVLLVGIVWGGSTLVELEQVAGADHLTVGRLFDLPAPALPKNFQLVKHAGGSHVVTLPDNLHAEVHRGRGVSPLARTGKRVDAPFRGHSYTIGDEDRVVAQITPSLTLIARYVRAERQKDKPLRQRIDAPFAATLLAALLLLLGFLFLVRIAPHRDPLSREAPTPERIARYQVKPPEKLPETAKPRDVSGAKEGEKSKGEEGKLGKPEAKKKEAAPSKPGTPAGEANKKAKDLAKVKKLGLIAALSKMGVPSGAGTLGPGGLGAGVNPSLGGTRASAGIGDSYGVGGLGTRGAGPGGGGNALGIGGLGTKGTGHGRGGYGVDLGGRGKDETVFVPGRTTVVGGLSREVINRVIQKHYSEIKYCYEKELSKNPELYGKVTVLFLIDGGGAVGEALVQQTTLASDPVETCMINHVRRWAFPAPRGGGTVQVTYPYVFKSTGQ